MRPQRKALGSADSIALEPEEQFDRVPPITPVGIGAGTPDGLRRYAVYRGLILIGTTNLEMVVEAGVRAAGIFYPESEFGAVRSVFALYRRAADRSDKQLLREFVRRRDQLGLRVWRAGVAWSQVVVIPAFRGIAHLKSMKRLVSSNALRRTDRLSPQSAEGGGST
jgi:hypothetical protein